MALIQGSIGIYVLALLFLVLLIPYIKHYYFLENSVQKMYLIYNKLEQLSGGKMNFDLVPRRYRVTDEQIDDGDFQAIVTPLWWEVSIYDGETEMYDALDRFTDPQKYVWAIQWYYSEVENGGHDQFFYNDTGIVWELALERTPA